MITEREKVILDRIHALASEHFVDYAVFVRQEKCNGVSWRVSNGAWGESVTRNYSETVRIGNAIGIIRECNEGGS